MKKIFILILIYVSSIILSKTYAFELQETKLDYYYSIDGQIKEQMSSFKDNQKQLYYLRPLSISNNEDYNISYTLKLLELTNKKIDYIQRLLHFANTYSDIKYFLAAQELIWETTTFYEIDWYNNYLKVNVDKEKEILNTLIIDSSKLPAFNNSKITVGVSQKITVMDLNNVLNYYETSSLNATIENNNILYYTDDIGLEKIELTRRFSNSCQFKIYTLNDKAKFIYSNGLYRNVANIYLNSVLEYGILKIGIDNTLDTSDLKYNVYAQEDIYNINNILLYNKDDLVVQAIPNVDYKLNLGKYYIIQTESDIYVFDNINYIIELNETNSFILVNPNVLLKTYQEKPNDSENKIDNDLNKEDDSENKINNDLNKEDDSENKINNDLNKEDDSENKINNDLDIEENQEIKIEDNSNLQSELINKNSKKILKTNNKNKKITIKIPNEINLVENSYMNIGLYYVMPKILIEKYADNGLTIFNAYGLNYTNNNIQKKFKPLHDFLNHNEVYRKFDNKLYLYKFFEIIKIIVLKRTICMIPIIIL